MFVSGESYHRNARGCNSSWTRRLEQCPLLLIYPARRPRCHSQYQTLCVTVGEYRKYSLTQNILHISTLKETWASLKTLHAHKHTHLYDEFGEGFSERLQQFRYFFSAVQLKAADSDSGQITHQTGHHLNQQQHQHRQPVKTVMDRHPSKRPWKREHRR